MSVLEYYEIEQHRLKTFSWGANSLVNNLDIIIVLRFGKLMREVIKEEKIIKTVQDPLGYWNRIQHLMYLH